jgi:hypothetical protein
MTEWWTYRLSDFLLFAPATYQRLFELYNTETWPALLVALAASILLTVLAVAGHGRAAAALLAVGWLWVAWAFHWQRYSTINWAAQYFAVAFAVQAALLAWAALRDSLQLSTWHGVRRRIGFGVLIAAIVLWPLLAPLSGQPWNRAELAGMAPDPTAAATIGILLAASQPRWLLAALPVLWCLVSALTLWAMDAAQAVVPLAAALSVPLSALAERGESSHVG